MRPKQLVALVALAAVWGGSFLFIRFAVAALGPFLLMVMRVAVAAILLLAYAGARKRLHLPQFRQHWRHFLVVGALNSAIPFSLIGFSQLHLTASLGSILNSTTTLFAALLTAMLLEQRLAFSKIAGLVMGVAGVAILVGWSPLQLSANVIVATGAALLAAVSYACAGIYSARHFRAIPPLSVAVGQQLGATALLLPFGAGNVPGDLAFSPTLMFAVFGLASLSTALAYILYFYLIDEVGPTKTLSVTYLIPVFGTLWGVVFLHETVNAGVLAGLVMILLSMMLVHEVSVGMRHVQAIPMTRQVGQLLRLARR